MKVMKSYEVWRNDNGMVLPVSIILIAVLVLLGITAIMMTTTDLKISSNYREDAKALCNAEAGAEFFLDYMRVDAKAASPAIIYPATTGGTVAVAITLPAGFSFNSSVTITCIDSTQGLYKYQMTGTGANNASKTIEVVFKRGQKLPAGADGAVAILGGGPAVALSTGGGSSLNIDGHNYPVPNNPNCSGNSCRTSPSATGATAGVYTPSVAAAVTGNLNRLDGVPAQKVGGGLHTQQDWINFVNDVLSDPTAYQANVLGTRANPKITVVDNNTNLSGNANGAGLIIVKDGGSFSLGGNVCFEGVIVLVGNGNVATSSGTSIIYGSLVTISHTSKTINTSGGTNLFYSGQATTNIATMASLQRFQRISWKDVH